MKNNQVNQSMFLANGELMYIIRNINKSIMSYHTCVSMEEPGAGEGSMLWLCCNLERFTPNNMLITHRLLHNVGRNPQQPLSCDPDWSIAMLWSPEAVGKGMCLDTALLSKLTWPFFLTFTPHSMEFTKKSQGPPEPLKSRSHGYMLSDSFFFWLS